MGRVHTHVCLDEGGRGEGAVVVVAAGLVVVDAGRGGGLVLHVNDQGRLGRLRGLGGPAEETAVVEAAKEVGLKFERENHVEFRGVFVRV